MAQSQQYIRSVAPCHAWRGAASGPGGCHRGADRDHDGRRHRRSSKKAAGRQPGAGYGWPICRPVGEARAARRFRSRLHSARNNGPPSPGDNTTAQPDSTRLTSCAVSIRPEPTLFYVVDWLPPDFGAIGQYAEQYATELAQTGRRVCLIGLTGAEGRRTDFAIGRGALETVRLSATAYDKSRLGDRLLWTFRVCMRLTWEVVRRHASYRAELLFTGAPPFFLYFAVLAKLIRRVRLICRITDFYPEVLIAEFGGRHCFLALLQRTTWLLRRQAVDRFEVLGFDQRRLLIDGGIRADRIRVRRDTSPVVLTGS